MSLLSQDAIEVQCTQSNTYIYSLPNEEEIALPFYKGTSIYLQNGDSLSDTINDLFRSFFGEPISREILMMNFDNHGELLVVKFASSNRKNKHQVYLFLDSVFLTINVKIDPNSLDMDYRDKAFYTGYSFVIR